MPYPGPAKSPTEPLQTCLAGPTEDRIFASIFTGRKPYSLDRVPYFLQKTGHYVEKKFLEPISKLEIFRAG